MIHFYTTNAAMRHINGIKHMQTYSRPLNMLQIIQINDPHYPYTFGCAKTLELADAPVAIPPPPSQHFHLVLCNSLDAIDRLLCCSLASDHDDCLGNAALNNYSKFIHTNPITTRESLSEFLWMPGAMVVFVKVDEGCGVRGKETSICNRKLVHAACANRITFPSAA